MDHYVQYHNPDLIGTSVDEVAENEEFAIGTNKTPPRDMVGSRVWLMGGEGRPRRYYLCYVFVADKVLDAPDGQFRYTISGTEGTRFIPPRELDEPWFAGFLRFNANFSLGLRKIPEDYVRLLEAIR